MWQVWRDHFAQLWLSFLVGAHAAGLIVVALGDLAVISGDRRPAAAAAVLRDADVGRRASTSSVAICSR